MATLMLLREILGGIALVGGAAAVMIGAVGLIRFSDVYQRMHASGVVDTGGAGLILLGLLLLAPDWHVAIRLILIGAVLVFTSPTATHAISRAAHANHYPFNKTYDTTHGRIYYQNRFDSFARTYCRLCPSSPSFIPR